MGRCGARARRATPILLAMALVACRDDSPGSETVEPPGSSSTGDPGPLRPSFAEPASGRLVLPSVRGSDLVLAVTGVTPNATSLVVDGRNFGPLSAGSELGVLEPEALRLYLRGSIVLGSHRMMLRTGDVSGLVESEEVIIDIAAAQDAAPVVSAPLATERGADRVGVSGDGDEALLLLVEQAPEGARLHLVPRGERGWSDAAARTLWLPGLVLGPEDRALPVSAQRRGLERDPAGRVRVAWRVGATGSRIDIIDTAWDTADPSVEPRASLGLAEGQGGESAEWAQWGRPVLADDLLLAELWAPRDVESPRPGDHAVVFSRIHGDATALDPPQRVSVRPDRVDLDRLGPAVDRIGRELEGPTVLSVRADRHQALLLEVDAARGVRVRPTRADGRERSFDFIDTPLATIAGAFGSRTIAGLGARADGRLRVIFVDDLGATEVATRSLSPDDLPPLDAVTGALAPASVNGLSVFLVPYGATAPVQAVHTVGDAVRVTPLPELQCDGIVAAPFDVESGEVPLACVFEGALSLATLSSEPVLP